MKHFYTILFCVIFIPVVNSQIISIPDALLKSKLLDSQNLNVAYDFAGYSIEIDSNSDNEIQLSEALLVRSLNLVNSNITDATGINYFTNLEQLVLTGNQLTQLSIPNLSNLKILEVGNNNLVSLNVLPLTNLEDLNFHTNPITNIDVSNLVNLQSLIGADCELTSVNLSGCTALDHLHLNDNNLASLNIIGLQALQTIRCEQNNLTTFLYDSHPNLYNLYLTDNELTEIDLLSFPNLHYLYFDNNMLESIDINNSTLNVALLGNNNLTHIELTNATNLANLTFLNVGSNQLTTLNVENCPSLFSLFCQQNPLVSIFAKNGANENIITESIPTLEYVCIDENQITNLQQQFGLLQMEVSVNSYCSFTPGGSFNVINSTMTVDVGGDGCDGTDQAAQHGEFAITSGTSSGSFFGASDGQGVAYVGNGTYTITPVLENPDYFTVSPASHSINFPESPSPSARNFCLTPIGSILDFEVVLVPLEAARPGFDIQYLIMVKNKGNQTAASTVTLLFDGSILDFVASSEPVLTATGNSLDFSVSSLHPLESKWITVTLNLNSPTEIPAVNGGETLAYTLSIPNVSDAVPADNTFILNDTVVNSYDPNDKICLEGTSISPSMVGEYVHYMIRFENTGTYAAQNIVVTDMIDPAKFDISSLVPLNGSHAFDTRINGNRIEFIFENIMLPFDDATNDGYVAFKIKTLPTLAIGDTFSNSASIYFDYNFPIVTDPAVTTIQNLGNADFDFGRYFTIYPNPASNVVNIKSSGDITVKTIDVYNILGQLVIAIPNAQTTSSIDISQLKTGTYFLKINSDKGATNAKFLRK